jgi:hypothetical protein
MEESGEQCTVVFAEIVTEPGSAGEGCFCVATLPPTHTQTLTSRFRNN